MQTLKTETLPGRRRATYYLVVGRGHDRPAALTVGVLPDEEALAVFSFREEALFFLSVQNLEEDWTAKEFVAADLVSFLLDPRPAWVALDPLPGPLGGRITSLLSVPKERFLRDLLRKRSEAESGRSVALRLDLDQDGQEVVREIHPNRRFP